MIQNALIEIEIPIANDKFKLPKGVDNRLQELLDRQDRGKKLTVAERKEAEGLIDLAEMLTLLKLKSKRIARESQK